MRISDWSSDVCSSDLLLTTIGVERVPGEVAVAGDICAVAGFTDIMIGDTLADLENPVALPRITVDQERKSVVKGQSVSVRVDLGGRRQSKKKRDIMSREGSWVSYK